MRLVPGPMFCTIIGLAFLSLAHSFAALAQTSASARLPPAAQVALNKGVLAAKAPDFPLAIRYFEDARKLAPDAPVIFMNLGIAESKIPGRELRAIAWFGAYLAAATDAPNAAAVKEQIAVLDVRSRSNVSALIKIIQDAALQKLPDPPKGSVVAPGELNDLQLSEVGELWIGSGDIGAALKTIGLFNAPQTESDFSWQGQTLFRIAIAQTKAGDIAGAKKTASAIMHEVDKTQGLQFIAEAQIDHGDIVGAQKTLGEARDFVGRIKEEERKQKAEEVIAEAQAKLNSVAAGLAQTAPSGTGGQDAVKVADWIEKLDDANENGDCPLAADPFLDLADYLKAQAARRAELYRNLPASGQFQEIFKMLHKTGETIVKAQNVVHQMLKQQASE